MIHKKERGDPKKRGFIWQEANPSIQENSSYVRQRARNMGGGGLGQKGIAEGDLFRVRPASTHRIFKKKTSREV